MEHNNYKILAINFGSTSTKIAVYAGEEKLLEHGFLHSCEDMEGVSTMEENAAMRKPLILDFLTHHGHSLESFDAVVGRGGLVHPIPGGTYAVNDEMLRDLRECRFGTHVCNLGGILAAEIGEEIGKAGPDAVKVDIAVDPLDGTTSTAKGLSNAIAVIALAPRGNLYHTKNYYMSKLAVGPKAKDAIDLEKPLKENLLNVADALNKKIEDLTVTILERDRHKDIMAQCRQLGCRIKLFTDGDVGAAIATCFEDSGVDVLAGIGGCPEGVLAAAALKCLGGEIQGRLVAHTSEEIRRSQTDPSYYKVMKTDDLAAGDDVLFIATGVSDGDMLKGVRFLPNNKVRTHTVVMRSATGTVRFIEALHDMNKKPPYAKVVK